MKLFSSVLLTGLFLSLSAPSFAAQKSFFCPSNGGIENQLVSILNSASSLDESVALKSAQKASFLYTITNGVPNMNVVTSSFEFEGKAYEFVGVKGGFLGQNPYPDSTGAIFEAGKSDVVGIVSTDTDRSIVRCKAVVANKAAYVSLSADDFDWLVGSVKDTAAVYQGESYINFTTLTSGLAQGTDELGLPVVFVRGN